MTNTYTITIHIEGDFLGETLDASELLVDQLTEHGWPFYVTTAKNGEIQDTWGTGDYFAPASRVAPAGRVAWCGTRPPTVPVAPEALERESEGGPLYVAGGGWRSSDGSIRHGYAIVDMDSASAPGDRYTVVTRCATLVEAENYIGALPNTQDVERGRYGIDGPDGYRKEH